MCSYCFITADGKRFILAVEFVLILVAYLD